LDWLKFLPRIGDLFVLEYHRGRRVGIFVRRELKEIVDHRRNIGIVWVIMWIPVESDKMPSSHLSELTIMNYLKTGKGKIYRRDDEI
tara:strand:+ start:4619 stop:4879 length:261 start_codon:yes stop_codon:yes gene_type:complete